MEMWERLIQAAQTELDKGNVKNAKSIVAPFLEDSNKNCRVRALDLMARILLREKSFTEASTIAEKLVSEVPTVSRYMMLMAAYQHSLNLVGFKETFERAFLLSEQQKAAEFSPINILFYYLDGLLSLKDYLTAGQIIDEITIIYRSLKTLESQTLFAAGIPFYNDFLALVSKYFGQQNLEKEFQAWLIAQLEWVDKYGEVQIKNYIREKLH